MRRITLAKMAVVGLAMLVVACSPSGRFGPPRDLGVPTIPMPAANAIAPAQGEIVGTGAVRVALILPLSGSASTVGQSMANGARLAMDHVVSTGGQYIHLVVKDSGSSSETARLAAQQALAEGARLILGPLTADAVASAGAVAKPANVPLIGFSSTSSVATDGIYLLSVLPEAEIMRALGYARTQGRQTVAAIIPDTPLGRVQAETLRQAAGELGMRVAAIEMFADEARARTAIERLAPAIRSDQIDTLYIPDRATAPSFGILLDAARIDGADVTIVGSADWEGEGAIASQATLSGAVYPAIDPAGLAAMTPQYRARFGSAPHQFATLAFTAVILANNSALSGTTPPYGNALLAPSGFRGRDGLFRFHFDGRGEYGLVMRRIEKGRAITIDPVRLGGLPLLASGAASLDAAIPPAAEFR